MVIHWVEQDGDDHVGSVVNLMLSLQYLVLSLP